MHIAEVVTIAKSLPLLRLNTYKSLILSYSADYRRIFRKSSCIHDILQNYQIGFTCSKSEGFGRVTAEYMLAKLGVIASDTGANPELIKDGFTGLLYREGDVKNLLQKMLYWINNRENLIECSKKAYLFAKDNFTSVVNADNIYKHYLYLLE